MKSSECVQLPSVAVSISCDMSTNQTDMDMSLALTGHREADQRRNDVGTKQDPGRLLSLVFSDVLWAGSHQRRSP